MSERIEFRGKGQAFNTLQSRLRAVAEEVLPKVTQVFGADGVRVIFEENPEMTIPERGVGGYTPDSHSVFVYIDPASEALKAHLEQNIRSTITHEYHHAIRNRAIDWRTDTLLGAMVTEGLADHFDLEVNGGEPPPWAHALTEEQLQGVLERARPEFQGRGEHGAWLFGSVEQGIPKWAGYTLGYKLVADYIELMGKKASALVATPAEEFIK